MSGLPLSRAREPRRRLIGTRRLRHQPDHTTILLYRVGDRSLAVAARRRDRLALIVVFGAIDTNLSGRELAQDRRRGWVPIAIGKTVLVGVDSVLALGRHTRCGGDCRPCRMPPGDSSREQSTSGGGAAPARSVWADQGAHGASPTLLHQCNHRSVMHETSWLITFCRTGGRAGPSASGIRSSVGMAVFSHHRAARFMQTPDTSADAGDFRIPVSPPISSTCITSSPAHSSSCS